MRRATEQTMTKPRCNVIGNARIFTADLWEARSLDLVAPADNRFDPDGRGDADLGEEATLNARPW